MDGDPAIEIVDHTREPDPPELAAGQPEESFDTPARTVEEILAPKADPAPQAVIPFPGSYEGEPESTATPSYPADQLDGADPNGIASLTAADPFEQNFGFSSQRASEIAAGAELFVPEERVSEFIQAFEHSGLDGEDGFRQFCAYVRSAEEETDRKQAEREEINGLRQAIEEMRTQGPGSPMESRLANIEMMLNTQREQEQERAYIEQESQKTADLHAAALGQLVGLARARGIEPPDPAAVEAFYQRTGAIRLEPSFAAKLAWSELVGPELFGPGKSTELPFHPTRNPRGSIVIPAGSASTAAPEPTIRDLIQTGE